jgi:DMSO/TMAO reductase YedYZ molybdopterin-dependent catalytic subunit
VLGSDKYGQTFTYKEVAKSALDMYDPKTGDKVKPSEKPVLVLAYEENGEPISPGPSGDGPLRLVVAQPHSHQVADGHVSVKWVASIQVATAKHNWKLKVLGPTVNGKRVSYYLDRHSYQSCAAPGCHGASWTDKSGHVWSGVPLFLLMGRVDGGAKHKYGAFNGVLAQQGYTITLASGKKRVKLGSHLIAYNENILLAGTVDGKELATKYYPLRLVGKKLKKAQMVGRFSWVHATLVKKH